MKNLFSAVLVLLMALAIRAGAQSSSAKDMFAGKCAMCHSADGSANSPVGKGMKIPSFLSTSVQSQPDAELKGMIANGKGTMPKFGDKLTDAQIDQMVAYIRTLGKK